MATDTAFVFPLPKGVAPPSSKWSLDQGVDITAPAHTSLLAVGAGTIVGHGINGFGRWAPILKLDKGGYVYYGHAGPGHAVKVGTRVSAGQVIGEVGAGRVGISTGPHLEIGYAANAAGQPVGGSTAKQMALNLMTAHAHKPFFDPGAAASSVIATVADAPGKAAEAGAADVAQATAKAMVDYLWGSITKPADGATGSPAARVLLYVLLAGGGLAIALGGVRHLSKPEGTPA
jgi:murein DD-endopeptidase MepM/ murein hydrolase activator NlpD